MKLLNDISRLQRVKERFGIRIRSNKPLEAHKELTTLKREIANSYKDSKEYLYERYIFTSRTPIEDWINTIPVMKPRTYARVKTIFQEEGIESLLTTFLKHKLRV